MPLRFANFYLIYVIISDITMMSVSVYGHAFDKAETKWA